MSNVFEGPIKKKCFMEVNELDGSNSLVRLDHVSMFSTWTNPDKEPSEQVQLTLACGMVIEVDPSQADQIRSALRELKS